MIKSVLRYSLLLLILPGLLQSISCAKLAPRSTALRQIHHTYRGEFDQYLQLTVPAPLADGTVSVGSRGAESSAPAPFASTLREIRAYRIRYGENNRESAHLTVLEGMIYLQTGQLGMARLLLPDLRRASESLGQGTGAAVRDRLLAQNFDSLLAGWTAIREPETRDSARRLAEAAGSIGIRLGSPDRPGLERGFEPEVDEGAIYLATSGAIFYAWVGKILSLQSREDRPCWCAKGMALIAPHLSETERRIARGIDFQSIPAGRTRYLGWYNSLARCAGERPLDNCHERLK
ncbi:MAG: hypothetical protein EBU88_06640 [Acidobacteria bacterium]|nr:hypothetical protein [Acidobacteriota bacterium]